MNNEKLATLLYPETNETPQFYEKRYPPRDLPEGAVVSRLAPSPTGFVHLGNILQALTSERLAHRSGGVLFLRVEDTDAKREVKGAVKALTEGLKYCGIEFDEGESEDGDKGAYGPYRQRRRVPIYHCFAKELVKKGLAYPCFCTEEELFALREEQKASKTDFGYYGKWARWRDRPVEEIQEELLKKTPWVLRFRSEGKRGGKIQFTDLIKGEMEVSENYMDHVLIKSDGVPTYHFAHAVDDHLMRTTHVVRGDEWLPSLPFHIELFGALGFETPKYLHIGTLMKQDGASKRKLSKRKDPEGALSFYKEKGYPVEAIYDYALTILNSNFEDWRRQNPEKSAFNFPFSYKKMNPAGSLFDEAKLLDISKNVVSKLSSQGVYERVLAWAKEYDRDFGEVLEKNKEKAIKAFSIGRDIPKPRKDIAFFSGVKAYIGFIFDEYHTVSGIGGEFDKNDVKNILKDFLNEYSPGDDQTVWFSKIKRAAEKNGFAPEIKEYKKNPGAYKGSVADAASFIRVAVTGRENSPDLFAVMGVLGYQTTVSRVKKFKETL